MSITKYPLDSEQLRLQACIQYMYLDGVSCRSASKKAAETAHLQGLYMHTIMLDNSMEVFMRRFCWHPLCQMLHAIQTTTWLHQQDGDTQIADACSEI